jgi:hypothetical protein
MRYLILKPFSIGEGREFKPDTEVDGARLPKDRMDSAVRNGWAKVIDDKDATAGRPQGQEQPRK